MISSDTYFLMLPWCYHIHRCSAHVQISGVSRLAVSTAWAVRALSATALAVDLLLAGHIGRRSLEHGQQGQQGRQG